MSFVRAKNILITALISVGHVANFSNIRQGVAKLQRSMCGHEFPNGLYLIFECVYNAADYIRSAVYFHGVHLYNEEPLV